MPGISRAGGSGSWGIGWNGRVVVVGLVGLVDGVLTGGSEVVGGGVVGGGGGAGSGSVVGTTVSGS
ncbi:hypothetical protein, partial [Nocardia farcinica]